MERKEFGLRVVGAPIGTREFCVEFCRQQVETHFEERVGAIEKVSDTQAALIMLRYCHCTRFGFMLRATPPDIVREAAAAMDARTRKALDTIHDLHENSDCKMDNTDWAQAQLSIKNGGLGIWSSARASHAAYA